jgi:hypothetical protein
MATSGVERIHPVTGERVVAQGSPRHEGRIASGGHVRHSRRAPRGRACASEPTEARERVYVTNAVIDCPRSAPGGDPSCFPYILVQVVVGMTQIKRRYFGNRSVWQPLHRDFEWIH